MSKRMLEQVLRRSRDHVGTLLRGVSFAGREDLFGRVSSPVTLGGVGYNLRFFKHMSEHPVWGRDTTLAYTFFLTDVRFCAEHEDFEPWKPALASFLRQQVFPGRRVRFAFHLATPTRDGATALVFYEVVSAVVLATTSRVILASA